MTESPTVTLAGREWPVRPLVVAQLRTVVPAIMRLAGMTPTAITEAQYGDLIEVVYQSVAPGQAAPFTRDDFLALPITLLEMISALEVIMPQAGLVRSAAPGEPLEAGPSTGTPSSPSSASA